jgi:hypothetical protein
MIQEPDRFVRDALARGVSRERIAAELARAGWPADEVQEVLGRWLDSDTGVPVPRRRVQLSAREAFLYLVMFATLYIVAYHTGAIAFAWIEYRLPDPAMQRHGWSGAREWVRLGVASLAVAFPVFLWTARLLGGAMARDPGKRNSGVRRWLTYLTLFVAAGVLIGDFIAVLLGLLNGELTGRFVLKALVVASIAGFTFVHYLGALRRDEADAPAHAAPPAWLPRLAATVVVAALVAGFVLSGTPAQVREMRLDQQRLQDLQALSLEVMGYHERFGVLPGTLADLAGAGVGGPGMAARLDPVTRAPYGYAARESLAFALWAVFDAADSLGPHGLTTDPFWRHDAGPDTFVFRVPPRR